tara:strand:+ start:697 stop:957 length:261 start_codon:yes stop_codon:yes gene_type:complete
MRQLAESTQKRYGIRKLCDHLDRFMQNYYLEPHPYRFDFYYWEVRIYDAKADAYLFLTKMEDYQKAFILSDVLPDIYGNVPSDEEV